MATPEETTPPTPEPDTEATPEETSTPIATVTVNEGVMEVSPECFDDDTPVLTYQPDTDKPNSVHIGDSHGIYPVYTYDLVPFLTFTVENLRSIIFSTPTVRSANPDFEPFDARLRVKGNLGDVRIDYVHTQTWPDQFGPLPSLRYFSPTNRFCFVEISFNANMVMS